MLRLRLDTTKDCNSSDRFSSISSSPMVLIARDMPSSYVPFVGTGSRLYQDTATLDGQPHTSHTPAISPGWSRPAAIDTAVGVSRLSCGWPNRTTSGNSSVVNFSWLCRSSCGSICSRCCFPQPLPANWIGLTSMLELLAGLTYLEVDPMNCPLCCHRSTRNH